MDVDKADKPLDDVTITSIEVLWNPFDDIVPSVAAAALLTAEAAAASKNNSAAAAGKSARKSTKDKKLLSFGDEEEGEDATEEASTWATAKATKKMLAAASGGSSSSKAKSMNEAEEMSAGRVSVNLGKRKAEELVLSGHLDLAAAAAADSSSSSASNRADAGTGTGTDTDTGIAIETTAMKIARMKKELAHSLNDTEAAPAGSATGSSNSAGAGAAAAAGKAGNLLEQQRAKYTTRGAEGGAAKKLKRGDEGYEEAMLAKLSKFSGKMKAQSWAK